MSFLYHYCYILLRISLKGRELEWERNPGRSTSIFQMESTHWDVCGSSCRQKNDTSGMWKCSFRMSETTWALSSMPPLHCTKKKRSDAAILPVRKCVVKSSVLFINLLWKAFLVLGTLIKLLEKAFFSCHQGSFPGLVYKHIITLYEYSYQLFASNCC